MSKKKKTSYVDAAQQASAICPFYGYERHGYMHCEICRFKFADAQMRRDILYHFCAHPSRYRECQLYKIIQRYYERREQGGDKRSQN